MIVPYSADPGEQFALLEARVKQAAATNMRARIDLGRRRYVVAFPPQGLEWPIGVQLVGKGRDPDGRYGTAIENAGGGRGIVLNPGGTGWYEFSGFEWLSRSGSAFVFVSSTPHAVFRDIGMKAYEGIGWEMQADLEFCRWEDVTLGGTGVGWYCPPDVGDQSRIDKCSWRSVYANRCGRVFDLRAKLQNGNSFYDVHQHFSREGSRFAGSITAMNVVGGFDEGITSGADWHLAGWVVANFIGRTHDIVGTPQYALDATAANGSITLIGQNSPYRPNAGHAIKVIGGNVNDADKGET